MTYKQRLRQIKITLKRPYHVFTLAPRARSVKERILILEAANKEVLSFSGESRFSCIKEAEKYIKQLKDTGNL